MESRPGQTWDPGWLLAVSVDPLARSNVLVVLVVLVLDGGWRDVTNNAKKLKKEGTEGNIRIKTGQKGIVQKKGIEQEQLSSR